MDSNLFINDQLFRMQLIEARKSSNKSQKEISEISGLSASCISDIENNKAHPTLKTIVLYLNSIGYELHIKKCNSLIKPIKYL